MTKALKKLIPPFAWLFQAVIMIALSSCQMTTDVAPMETQAIIAIGDEESITDKLSQDFFQMKEREVAVSKDSSMYAQYATPTDRYRHGILGDAIEASQLVVVKDSVFYTLDLSNEFVFEDIRPRLANVDLEEDLEIICIRSHVDLGAGIAIYKITEEGLMEYAYVPEIGLRNRWLNIVSIQDLDGDGSVELSWIQTPHIGGVLKVGEITPGEISVNNDVSFYSNHGIGELNLCLSVVATENDKKVVYVPSQRRDKIVGFTYNGSRWEEYLSIDLQVDFSIPLFEQYNFESIITQEDNCINPTP